MSNNTNKNIVTKFIEEVWGKGNFDIASELIGPKYEIKNDPGDPYEFKIIDLTTFKQRLAESRRVFPDLHFDIKDVLSEDKKVTVSWFMLGTHKGDLPELPATNKKIRVSGITVYFLSENKIIGHWQVFDRLSMLAQLGVQIGQNPNKK